MLKLSILNQIFLSGIFKYIAIAGFLVNSLQTPLFAQAISMEQTVSYINSKLHGQCKIDVVKGAIVAKYYEKNEEFRKDKVSVKDLDVIRIGYEPEETIFFVPCKDNYEECVDRVLIANKIKKFSSRLSFVVDNNEKTINGLTEAFIHLYKLAYGPANYSRTKPFE
jgi:hypothetical protein